MKKEFTRDYVTEMFRKYAAAGMPTYEQERARIFAEIQANVATEQSAPYLEDIRAVEQTFDLLTESGEYDIMMAVKSVYCVSPSLPLRKGDITNRVNRFAKTWPTDARNVYRWLKEARLLCASMRGLSVTSGVNLKKSCQ